MIIVYIDNKGENMKIVLTQTQISAIMRAFELFLPDSNDFDSYNQYVRLCRKFRVKIMIDRKAVKYIYNPYTEE